MPTRAHPTAWLGATLFLTTLWAFPVGVAAQRLGPQWEGVPNVRVADVTLLHTADEPDILVRVIARGLSDASSFALLPDGEILVTEKEGRLRVIRDGVVDPTAVAGIPPVRHGLYSGLSEVVPHPDFARNRLIYLTYSAAAEQPHVAMARARWQDGELNDFEVLFRTSGLPITASGSRILFADDGSLFLTVGGAFLNRSVRAQDPADHGGKILRLTQDGAAPSDNPFANDSNYLPEIYSMGHRNPMGMAFHPTTGELWASEHAPQGGDEVNIIRPGSNYGWPIVSYGRSYGGARLADLWHRDGLDLPEIVWIPSVAPTGMIFYTGDRFPAWTGDLLVGSLMVGRTERTGHIERVVLNEEGQEIGREAILTELRHRIRDLRQGPDGLIYALTDEDDGDGLLLRIEPVAR